MLISSREPFTCPATNDLYDLARELKDKGHDVTLFLVENGVLAARSGVRCSCLELAAAAGVTILAESFSLRERAIPQGALVSGVSSAELDSVIDAMAAGVKTMWH
jgi:sulfur relay (sulfurtransferase) complex TusBCD TusD component (DsrE family)